MDPDEHPPLTGDEPTSVKRHSMIPRFHLDKFRFRQHLARPNVGLGVGKGLALPGSSVVAHNLGGCSSSAAERGQAFIHPTQLTVHPATDLFDHSGRHVDNAKRSVGHARCG